MLAACGDGRGGNGTGHAGVLAEGKGGVMPTATGVIAAEAGAQWGFAALLEADSAHWGPRFRGDDAGGSGWVWYQASGLKARLVPFMQKRWPVGLGPSGKMWPRWAPQLAQCASTLTMPCERSID